MISACEDIHALLFEPFYLIHTRSFAMRHVFIIGDHSIRRIFRTQIRQMRSEHSSSDFPVDVSENEELHIGSI